MQVRFQDHGQRGPKDLRYTPEVERIGKRRYGASGEDKAPSSL